MTDPVPCTLDHKRTQLQERSDRRAWRPMSLLTTVAADSRPHWAGPPGTAARAARQRVRGCRAVYGRECVETRDATEQTYWSEVCQPSATRPPVRYQYQLVNDQAPSSAEARLLAIRRELNTVGRDEATDLAASCSSTSPRSSLLPGRDWSPAAFWRWLTGHPGVRPEGSGEEVLLQAFDWESWRHSHEHGGTSWWSHLASRADELRDWGFTAAWLPPPTQSVSPQGYMPGDLYDLDSYYGSEAELRRCLAALRGAGLKTVADVVLNHRCAAHPDERGVYNRFGGRLAWDATAIVADDARFGGRGPTSKSSAGHAFFEAAPNLDHGSARVKTDLSSWLAWLREDVGFDGWRLDFARGFGGEHAGEYVRGSRAAFAVGEYWDGLEYGPDGRPAHCQDAHRARVVRWIDSAGGSVAAFDMTTKGVLHAALDGRGEYWRLRGRDGGAPGLLGLWPARAVTFVENHDTGSTQGHWRFPSARLQQGYAYVLTHPGTPCVFYDHAFLWRRELAGAVRALVAARRRNRVHCRSVLRVLRAEQGLYAAEIDGRLVCKLGPGNWQPERPADWRLACCGDEWAVWERAR